MALAALVGAVLSLIPWGVNVVVRLMLPSQRNSLCSDDMLYLCLPDVGVALVDLVLLAVVPFILIVLTAIVAGWILLHALRVRPAAPIVLLGLLLALLPSLFVSTGAPSVATTIIWAVSYVVAAVAVSAIRARRVSAG
jgi:hypothetical protein